MLIQTLFIIILLYFAFKAVGNLVAAMQHDQPTAKPRMNPFESNRTDAFRTRNGYTRQYERSAVKRKNQDVEDAKWVDIS